MLNEIKCAFRFLSVFLFNIRHAHRENLNVVLPPKGNYLSRAELFNRSTLADTPWNGLLEMDIFALHGSNYAFRNPLLKLSSFTMFSGWNYDEVVALMGRTVKTFTILRDPVDLFESLFSYYKLNTVRI